MYLSGLTMSREFLQEMGLVYFEFPFRLLLLNMGPVLSLDRDDGLCKVLEYW
jgi:hypothetical protein